MRRAGLAAAISMGLLAFTATDARADPPGMDRDYTYEFDDDHLLLLQPFGGCRWPPKRRPTIIRPRLHLVRELIETIEKM